MLNRHVLPIAAVVTLTAAFALWKADVLPGLWDLQHWGVDVAAQAEAERVAHRNARLSKFRGEEAAARVHAFDQSVQGATGFEAPARPPRVVFLGSSTIERWDLEASFPSANTSNRGIGDEPAAQLFARLDDGIAWATVDAAVVYVASVDVRRLHASVSEIETRARRVLDGIKARLDEGAPVLVLGLLSQRDLDAAGRRELDAANARIEQLSAERDFHFLPLDRAPLTGDDGRLLETYSVDRFHLNSDGYQVLTGWIRKNGGPLQALLFP